MRNKLYVGFDRSIDLPKGGFLFIDDEAPDLPDWKRARVFDPTKHSINPLKGLDEKKADELANVLYAISPQGENTLTVRNGRRGLRDALLKAKDFNHVDGDDEVEGMVSDILFFPVLKQVLCNPPNFSFGRGMNFARLNRAEIGDHVALVLGVLLMSHFKGQVVVPDFGFYGRDIHVSLIREGRLIAGVNFLEELPEKLRQNCLLIEDKVLTGATVEDAETAARYAGYGRGTQGFKDFVDEAVG